MQKSEHSDLRQLAEDLGLSQNLQAKINLSSAISDCREAGYDGLILDQVRADGLGSDLVLESEMNDAKEV